MNQLGLGVMIRMLCGNQETVEAVTQCLGQTIVSVECSDKSLTLKFENGKTLSLWDDGQSCCEHRYMTCDDELESYKGAKLVDVEVVDAPNASTEDGYGCHDVQFLNVKTNLGVIQVATHNEHNGYYGGFCITARVN